MAASLLSVVPLLLLSQIPLISAFPNVKPILIGHGNCSAYPNSFRGAGDNADAFIFVPDQADNSSINGLKTRITGINLVAYDNTTANADLASTIFCCDRGGTVLDGFGMQSLLVANNSTDEELGYLGQGGKPETYAHEIDGVRQDGVFLGMGNITTWAFRRGAGYWQIRLLGSPGNGDSKGGSLNVGESRAFLKILPPVI
jgi:hypothetical protein